MPISIDETIGSLVVQRNTNRPETPTVDPGDRPSPRVRAGADPIRVSLTENVRADARALSQAVRNASDGIAAVQTAEGGVNRIHNALVRMGQLAGRSVKPDVAPVEREHLNEEYRSLRSEIDRVAEGTRFDGRKLLDGSLSLRIEIGVDGSIQENVVDLSLGGLDADSLKLGGSIATPDEAGAALTSVTGAAAEVLGFRPVIEEARLRLASVAEEIDAASARLAGEANPLRDADIAADDAKLAMYGILLQDADSLRIQANLNPSIAHSLLS